MVDPDTTFNISLRTLLVIKDTFGMVVWSTIYDKVIHILYSFGTMTWCSHTQYHTFAKKGPILAHPPLWAQFPAMVLDLL